MERRERRPSTLTLTLTLTLKTAAAAMSALLLIVFAAPSSATTTTIVPNAAFAIPPQARMSHRRATATYRRRHLLASVPREASSSSSDGTASTAVGEPSPGGPGSEDGASVGPRGAAGTRRRRSTPGRRRPERRAATKTRPTSTTSTRKRAPHQFDHTTETAWSRTDGTTAAELVAVQDPNEDAPPMTWLSPPSTDENDGGERCRRGEPIKHPHLVTVSLDELFPNLGFSDLFASSTTFRDEIRNSIREDVFDTTSAYANMSDKARRMLLLPDSSLQGSWRCRRDDDEVGEEGGRQLRMKQLTLTLARHLGENAPTGDEFMESIGSLCGPRPSTHWIDIVGLTDRVVPQSWHQDTGRLARPSPDGEGYGDSRTVLLGFPPCDEYDGTGVFSHVVKLDRERMAPVGHPPGEPVLYGEDVDDEFVIRPRFARGREILAYRDVDVLHSAPDVAHRTSVMRFM